MERPKPLETDEGTWVFFPKRKENPLAHLVPRVREKCQEFFKVSLLDRLEIRQGDENRIRWIEECISVTDVSWVMEVVLKDQNEVTWLYSQIEAAMADTAKCNEWIGPWTFEGREGIAERYGF